MNNNYRDPKEQGEESENKAAETSEEVKTEEAGNSEEKGAGDLVD